MQAAPTFFIRDIPVYGDAILSPMDGYSDLPFRALCRELGSALSYTEFINALEILNGHPHVHKRYQYLPSERPVVFQIFDNDPDRLVRTALILRQYQPDIIDINMGCSAKGVAARGAGAGLLRTPLKIARTFRRLTHLLDIPITGKIRLGWDDASRNYCLVARIIEEEGGALVAVHGRTKVQAYSGNADWDAIAEVRQAVSIPVIANGDVRCAADIERLKAHTGCSAVMIGRAAISNPWIFSHRDRTEVSSDEVRAAVQRHLQLSLDFYGARRGIMLFRKYAARYLNPTGELRQRMLTTYNLQELMECVELALN
ncbi:MAG: tRNA-dihydrouridine synthase [Anaerolineales bacterium]|jgi:nifR3 family TIM-barrel protein|nr:tRNA-dihydrouridine synthase [Anaerolineales bacterium]